MADINAALDGLVFRPNLGFVGIARVALLVEDLGHSGSGGPMSGSGGVDIVVGNAPLLDLDANDSSGATGADHKANFRAGLGPVLIADLDATLSDPNSANLQRLTVRITNLLDGAAETLAANTGGTAIIASYNAATGTLLLTGSNSVANYQKVLRTITYNNAAATPNATARVVTFVAWDGGADSNVGTATVRYQGANVAPVAAADAHVLQEDQVLVVAAAGVLANDSDPDLDPLSAVLVSTTTHGLLTLDADGSFTYVPNAGFSGSDSFSYRASDGLLESAPTTVSISVEPVNAAPQGADARLAMNEDGALTITRAHFGYGDPGDTPANAMAGVLISVVPGSGTLRLHGAAIAAGTPIDGADIDAGALVYRPATNVSGTVTIGFQVRDDGGTDNGGNDTDPVVRWLTIDIAAMPDAPVLQRALPDRLATQDLPLEFTLDPDSFGDADAGDVLSYTASLSDGAALPAWLSFDAATLRFSGTPGDADVGTLTVRVTATDTSLASADGEFSIEIANVNDAPIAALALPDRSAIERVPVAFAIADGHFTDVDTGDVLGYAATLVDGGALPDWLDFDSVTRTFSGTPGNADVGTIAVRVTATDGFGASAFDDFALTVIGVNDPPIVVSPLPGASAVEDVPFGYRVPAGSFADIDAGDALGFSASVVGGAAWPAWLDFDAATLSFSGTPRNADVGAITLRVTATDQAGASVFADFQITVDNLNDAPTLGAALPDQIATQDLAFVFTLAAEAFVDVDADDVLQLVATRADGAALPAWLVFDAATGRFSGTPGNADVGSFSVRVTATDTASASVSGVFTLTVLDVNDAPRLARPIGDRGATLGTPFAFNLRPDTFVDIDAGDSIRLSAQRSDGGGLPTWLSFDAATGAFSGTPGPSDTGPVGIRVSATDAAGASAWDDFVINVVSVNAPPTLASPLADQVATEGLAFAFSIPAGSFADPDPFDALSLEAARPDGGALPGWLRFDVATHTFSGTPGHRRCRHDHGARHRHRRRRGRGIGRFLDHGGQRQRCADAGAAVAGPVGDAGCAVQLQPGGRQLCRHRCR